MASPSTARSSRAARRAVPSGRASLTPDGTEDRRELPGLDVRGGRPTSRVRAAEPPCAVGRWPATREGASSSITTTAYHNLVQLIEGLGERPQVVKSDGASGPAELVARERRPCALPRPRPPDRDAGCIPDLLGLTTRADPRPPRVPRAQASARERRDRRSHHAVPREGVPRPPRGRTGSSTGVPNPFEAGRYTPSS